MSLSVLGEWCHTPCRDKSGILKVINFFHLIIGLNAKYPIDHHIGPTLVIETIRTVYISGFRHLCLIHTVFYLLT